MDNTVKEKTEEHDPLGVIENYEETLQDIKRKKMKPEEQAMVFFPSNNIKVSIRKRKREKKEPIEPEGVAFDDLPLYSKRSVEFFKQPTVRVVEKYRSIQKLPPKHFNFQEKEFEVDREKPEDEDIKETKNESDGEESEDDDDDDDDSDGSTSEYEDDDSDEDLDPEQMKQKEEEKKKKAEERLKRREERKAKKEEEKKRKKEEKERKKKEQAKEGNVSPEFEEKVIQLITPSFTKTKEQVRGNLNPFLFHILHQLRNDEDYKWNGGYEKSECFRDHKKRKILEKPISFIVRIKKFETSFQEKFGDVEPLFLEMALYNTRKCTKISEDFHFDFNKEDTLSLIPKQRGVVFKKDKWDKTAMFSISGHFQDVSLVIILNKVLEGKEDAALDRYCRPDKFQPKDLKKLQTKLGFCERLGFLRQPIGYGVFPVFDDEDKIILQKVGVTKFFRLNGNQNMLKILSAPEKDRKNSLGSRKLKTVPVRCQFEVVPLGKNVVPVHKGDGIMCINNRVDVRKLVAFEEELASGENLAKTPFQKTYEHVLFFNPIQLLPKLSKAKNITVRIQLKENDHKLNDKETLSLIYGKSSQEFFVKTGYTKVTYKKKNPEFNDEFKIKLPSIITPNHHLLCVIYNVAIKKSASRSILQQLGVVVIPLMNKDGKIVDGEEFFPIITEFTDHVAGAGGNANSDGTTEGMHYMNPSTHKKVIEKAFHAEFRSVSTIYPKRKHVAQFFSNPKMNANNLPRTVKDDSYNFISNMPIIVNQMFESMCSKETSFEQSLSIFNSMVHSFNSMCVLMNDKKRSAVIWDYIQYHFVNPQSSKEEGGVYPYFRLLECWVKVFADGQNNRRAFSRSQTPTDDDEDGKEKFGSETVFYKTLMNCWIIFDLIYKSLVLCVYENKENPKPRNFDEKFSLTFSTFCQKVVSEVIYRINELTIAKDVNNKFALFLRDLMNVYDRGMILSMIHFYLQRLNQERMRTNNAVMQELALNFCKILGDYEHVVQMSIPRFKLKYSTQFTSSQYDNMLCDHSFLIGIIIRQVLRDVVNPQRLMRERAFEVIKNMLTKHEHDGRYQEKRQRRRVYQVFFPFVLLFLDNYHKFIEVAESDLREYEKSVNEANKEIEEIYTQIDEKNNLLEKENEKVEKQKDELIEQDAVSIQLMERIERDIKELKDEKLKEKEKIRDEANDKFEEEKSKVRIEKQNVFTPILSIIYNMNRKSLLNWMRVENKRGKFVIMMEMFQTIIKLFEYRGAKETADKEQKYGVNMTSSESLDSVKRKLEEMYSFGAGSVYNRGHATIGGSNKRFSAKLIDRKALRNSLSKEAPASSTTQDGHMSLRQQRKMSLRERRKQMGTNRLSFGRRSAGRGSYFQRKGGVEIDEGKVRRIIRCQKIMSNEITSCIQDIMLDLMKGFYSFDEDHSKVLEKVYEIILLIFQTHQSDDAYISNFRVCQVFLDLYRDDIYKPGTPFSEGICKELLIKCTMSSQEIRERAAACVYVLIKNNFLELGSFTRTKIQTTTLISTLVENFSMYDCKLLSKSFDNIALYANIDQKDLDREQEEKEKKLSKSRRRSRRRKVDFPDQLGKTIVNLKKLLFETRKIPIYKKSEYKIEKLENLYLSLSKGSKEAPELSVNWFRNLANLHLDKGKAIEAAECLLFMASHVFQYFVLLSDSVFLKLNFDFIRDCFASETMKNESYKELNDLFKEAGTSTKNRILKATQHFASEDFTHVGFIKLIRETIDLFDRSRYHEYKLNLYKLLEQYYLIGGLEKSRNFKKLMTIYSDLSQCCKTISEFGNENRYFGTYYMIEFASKRTTTTSSTNEEKIKGIESENKENTESATANNESNGEENKNILHWMKVLEGKRFVFRMPKLYRLSDVMDYIRKTYGGVSKKGTSRLRGKQDSSNTESTSSTKKDGQQQQQQGKYTDIVFESSTYVLKEEDRKHPTKVWCLIQHVEPHYEERIKNILENDPEKTEENISFFEKNTKLKHFIFETPFTKNRGTKLRSKRLDDQYKKKTILEVEHAFPSMKASSEIVNVDVVILEPIQNSIEIIDSSLGRLQRFQEFKERIEVNSILLPNSGPIIEGKKQKKEKRVDVNTLQMVLTGTVIPTVQEGIPAIVDLFLTPKYYRNRKYVKSVKELKNKLRLFLDYALFAIELNEKNMRKAQYDLHEQFICGYFKLWKLIASRVEKCTRFLKFLFKYLDNSVDLNSLGFDFENLFEKTLLDARTNEPIDLTKKDETTKEDDPNTAGGSEEEIEKIKGNFARVGTLKRGEMKKLLKEIEKKQKKKKKGEEKYIDDEELLENIIEKIEETEDCQKLNEYFDKTVKKFVKERTNPLKSLNHKKKV